MGAILETQNSSSFLFSDGCVLTYQIQSLETTNLDSL